ncbi:MAG TPA: phosphocholine cytidylyltransferase family protein [Gemmataceae bacterium]
MKAIILAAGMGRRLGLGLPKCLTPIVEDTTILDLQLARLRRFVERVTLVVGHQADVIMRRHPDCEFVHNAAYETTNTAASLALGLERVGGEDVIWVNGDVVFDPEVLARLVARGPSALATKRCSTGDEEVKYMADADGRLTAVSKGLTDGQGEAVGVNIVRAADVGPFREALAGCGRQDYFERGVETALARGVAFYVADVTDLACIEIDFPEDLAAARRLFGSLPEAARGPAAGTPAV